MSHRLVQGAEDPVLPKAEPVPSLTWLSDWTRETRVFIQKYPHV